MGCSISKYFSVSWGRSSMCLVYSVWPAAEVDWWEINTQLFFFFSVFVAFSLNQFLLNVGVGIWSVSEACWSHLVRPTVTVREKKQPSWTIVHLVKLLILPRCKSWCWKKALKVVSLNVLFIWMNKKCPLCSRLLLSHCDIVFSALKCEHLCFFCHKPDHLVATWEALRQKQEVHCSLRVLGSFWQSPLALRLVCPKGQRTASNHLCSLLCVVWLPDNLLFHDTGCAQSLILSHVLPPRVPCIGSAVVRGFSAHIPT